MALIACFSPAANALNCTALPLSCQSGHPRTRLRSPPSQKSPSAHFNLRSLLLQRAKRVGCCLLDSFCTAFPRRRFPSPFIWLLPSHAPVVFAGEQYNWFRSSRLPLHISREERVQLILRKELGKKMERDIRYHFISPHPKKI